MMGVVFNPLNILVDREYMFWNYIARFQPMLHGVRYKFMEVQVSSLLELKCVRVNKPKYGIISGK